MADATEDTEVLTISITLCNIGI